MSHPYRHLSRKQFWSSAMVAPAPGHIDPVLGDFHKYPNRIVLPRWGVVLLSIFPQTYHGGYNYYVTETAPNDLNNEDARKQNYGVFSARYGNVYIKQALQLFQRSLLVIRSSRAISGISRTPSSMHSGQIFNPRALVA